MKKFLFAVLIFMMVVAPAAVWAEGESFDVATEQNLYSTQRVMLYTASARNTNADIYEELYAEVYNAIKNKDAKLDVSKYQIPLNDYSIISKTVFDVVFQNPDLFYAQSGFGGGGYGDIVWEIEFKYGSHTSQEDAEKFYSKVDYVLASVVHEGMSDEEKALALHDYIVNNTTYDDVEDGVADDSYTSYSVLMKNFGVCQGYALAYNLLLGHVGIEAKYVSSEEMNHGWSMIKLDGKWYHVDTTWDDPSNVEIVSHDYFLLSDEGISNLGHTSWASDMPQCNDDKYEDASYSFSTVIDLMKYDGTKFCYPEYVPADLSNPDPDGEYYSVNGVICKKEYVRTYFDGSGREVVNAKYYNDIDSDSTQMFAPVKYIDGKFAHADFASVSGSEVFIKNDDADIKDTKISVAYYDDDKSLVSIKSYDVSGHDGYVSAVISGGAPSRATLMKIIYWQKGLKPLSNYIALNKTTY